MAKTMAVELTNAGVAQARSNHPENTPRKAAQLDLREKRATTYFIKSLGAELTLGEIKIQFQAHWTLLRKQSGNTTRPDKPGYNPTGEGPYATDYGRKIVAECKAILDKQGIRKV